MLKSTYFLSITVNAKCIWHQVDHCLFTCIPVSSLGELYTLQFCQRVNETHLRGFECLKKVFSHQIRWLWFQHDVNRSFRQSNQTGYKNFKRSLRIDFFFFVPHAAPILFHKKEQQSDRLCFSEPLTKRAKRANGRKKMAQSRR